MKRERSQEETPAAGRYCMKMQGAGNGGLAEGMGIKICGRARWPGWTLNLREEKTETERERAKAGGWAAGSANGSLY